MNRKEVIVYSQFRSRENVKVQIGSRKFCSLYPRGHSSRPHRVRFPTHVLKVKDLRLVVPFRIESLVRWYCKSLLLNSEYDFYIFIIILQ